MRLCEIEDKEKLKLLIKGNIFGNIETFNRYKSDLRNKSTDYLILKKNIIIGDLNQFRIIILNALATLYEYENDQEAESIAEKYEILLNQINTAKYMTTINQFKWLQK